MNSVTAPTSTRVGTSLLTASPQRSPIDGPVLRYPATSANNDAQGAEVRGVLEFEGDCLYLSVADLGERYPVVWPAETEWNAADQRVVLPAGQELALGDAVVGSGGYVYATGIARILGADAAEFAQRCVDNTYGEIAVVNNHASAIAAV